MFQDESRPYDEMTEIKQEDLCGSETVDRGNVKQEDPKDDEEPVSCRAINDSERAASSRGNDLVNVDLSIEACGDEESVFRGFEDHIDDVLEPLEKRLKLTNLSTSEHSSNLVLDETPCIEIDGNLLEEVDPLMPIEQRPILTIKQKKDIIQGKKAALRDQGKMGALQIALSQTQPLISVRPPIDSIIRQANPGQANPRSTHQALAQLSQPSSVLKKEQVRQLNKETTLHQQPAAMSKKTLLSARSIAAKGTEATQCCVVEKLISCRFFSSFRSDEDRQAIIRTGRPNVLVFQLKSYSTLYSKYTWLAGCNQRKSFYCWPCLLFAVDLSWTIGCMSPRVFLTDVQRHELSLEHKKAEEQLRDWKPIDDSSLIKMLVKRSLATTACWNHEERKKVIWQGRPCPILVRNTGPRLAGSELEPKLVYEKLYKRITWLTGCPDDGKFYCWPCLMFGFGQPWSYEGARGIMDSNFNVIVTEHETSCGHMEAAIKLKQYEFDIKPKLVTNQVSTPVGTITRNHSIVQYLTEVICVEHKRQNNTDDTWEDWAGSLRLLASYNLKLKDFIDEKTKAKGADYIDQIIESLGPLILDSIEYVMQEKIKQEVRDSSFVTIIFDHVSGSTNQNFLAVVVRYVNENATVIERFFKFINVNDNHVNFMEDYVSRVAVDLDCVSKVVGFTYDGFLVTPENSGIFNEKVRQFCPSARFFHYEKHGYGRILEQTLRHLPYCKNMFSVVSDLAIFFKSNSNSPDVIRLDNEIQVTKHSILSSTGCDFFVTLMNYYSIIMEFFKQVSKQHKDWKVGLVVQAETFYHFLNQPINRILVLLVGGLFMKIEALSKAFEQDRDLDSLKRLAKTFKATVDRMKHAAYETFLVEACKMKPEFDEATIKSLINDRVLREICCTIVTYAADLVSSRIEETENAYFKVECPDNNTNEQLYRCFLLEKDPDTLKTKILTFGELPEHFKKSKLLSELDFFDSNDFLQCKLFKDLVKTMVDYDLSSTVPEIHKLLRMALVIPRPSTQTVSTPVVTKVREYVENKKAFTTVDGLMWLERDLLSRSQNEKKFYEEVIDRVAEIVKMEDFPLLISK